MVPKCKDLSKARLGIDVGRVIINADLTELKRLASPDIAYHESFISVRPVQGGLKVIRRLVALFDRQVWLVSKAGKETQVKVCTWLAARDFFNYTGIPQDQVRFCPTFEGKGPIAKELELTHFIDDEPKVHAALTSVAHRILFRPEPFQWGRYPGLKGAVEVVANWPDAERIIRKSLR